MVQRSEIADEIVRVLGCEAAGRFFAAYGGKQILIADGTGRPGTFAAALIRLLGGKKFKMLQAHFGGERFTVPKGKAQAMIARNRQIVADYDAGATLLELVRKYDLTERRIRDILKRPE